MKLKVLEKILKKPFDKMGDTAQRCATRKTILMMKNTLLLIFKIGRAHV